MRKNTIGFAIPVVMAVVLLAGLAGVHAADSDLSTSVSGPPAAGPSDVATITVGYGNAGPDPAGSAYVDAYIPSGVPAPFDELTFQQRDDLEASVVPDGLGNSAFLFNDLFCEHLLLQVQEDDGDPLTGPPMVGLGAGVSDQISFDLVMPMDPPEIGGVIIDEPVGLAIEFKAAVTPEHLENAYGWSRYGRGDCALDPECLAPQFCFTPRVSFVDPIAADFELVDDGTADPTFGCEPLIGFTPGNIAVIERGTCEFGVKGVNAQDAGATAVLLVNDGRCGTGNPDSTICVLNMGAGLVGDQVTIPMVLVSVDDGQPVIDALQAATPVRGRFGAVSETLTLDAYAWLSNGLDDDPDPSNDNSTFELLGPGIFADGFESGDTAAWSNVAP
jgi:hypothetical protein